MNANIRSYIDHLPLAGDMAAGMVSRAPASHWPEAGDMPQPQAKPQSYVDHFPHGGDLSNG